MQKSREGDQEFDKVLGYTRQRLDQNSVLEDSVAATNENFSTIDFSRKPNFLADQRNKKRIETMSAMRSLKARAIFNKTSNQLSTGLLLRETSQERNLAKMQNYE